MRNELILKAIAKSGYSSVRSFCIAESLNPNPLWALIKYQEFPIVKSGEFSKTAKDLMEIFGAAPCEFWTEEELFAVYKEYTDSSRVGTPWVDRVTNAVYFEYSQRYDVDFDDTVSKIELKEAVSKALTTLGEKETEVIKLRYLEDMSVEEVAQTLNLTTSRIIQIEKHALHKLKHPCRNLKQFCEVSNFIVNVEEGSPEYVANLKAIRAMMHNIDKLHKYGANFSYIKRIDNGTYYS